jgi:glycosyltransferase involved in cell wall biosynthesis
LEKYLRREAMENVTLMGYKPPEELPALIQRALFTVLPSEWHENRPRSVLESFSLARTVVASRIGGIPELVKDQETGLTFEAGNAIDLREKIQFLMNNPPLARALGRNALRFVQEDWTPEKYYRALMEIYTIARERQP